VGQALPPANPVERRERLSHPMSLADAFLEQSPACHWIVDGACVFHRIYGDPSSVLGRTAAELLGKSLDVLDPERAASWKGRVTRALAGEALTVRDRRAETTWNISIFPIRADGVVYAGALAREVSAWNTAEHELRHTVLGALKAMEFERKTVSKFLHDSVGQNLTAFGLQLDLLRMDLEEVLPGTGARVNEMQAVLEEMMEKVRAYSHELNPSTVERAGLRPALDRLAVRMRERFSGTIRLNVDPSLKLDPRVASAMYQIAQEAVENSVQHSGCTMIEITVRFASDRSYMEVKDNGRGFDPGDLSGGFRGLGLLSMEHYAAQAGLELALASDRRQGTTVRATAVGGS
jgi:signal transduction histidine kinase